MNDNSPEKHEFCCRPKLHKRKTQKTTKHWLLITCWGKEWRKRKGLKERDNVIDRQSAKNRETERQRDRERERQETRARGKREEETRRKKNIGNNELNIKKLSKTIENTKRCRNTTRIKHMSENAPQEHYFFNGWKPTESKTLLRRCYA